MIKIYINFISQSNAYEIIIRIKYKDDVEDEGINALSPLGIMETILVLEVIPESIDLEPELRVDEIDSVDGEGVVRKSYDCLFEIISLL